jgi:hypothetical protein
MLPRMAGLAPGVMRRMAALSGYDWSEEELQALEPIVERALALVARLEALPLQDVEPGILFRMA